MTVSAEVERHGPYIQGAELPPDGREMITVRNPANAEAIAEVVDATDEDLARAVADGWDVTTQEQFQRVLAYLHIGAEEGATAITGGVAVADRSENGYFVPPTIFTGVTNTMRIAREEIFGPVVGVLPFHDEEEAVAIANDSDFGLVAGVWSTNLSQVHRVAVQLEVGQVYVNEYYAGYAGGVETPFGGTKNSGTGREKGLEALKGYTQSRTVVIKL